MGLDYERQKPILRVVQDIMSSSDDEGMGIGGVQLRESTTKVGTISLKAQLSLSSAQFSIEYAEKVKRELIEANRRQAVQPLDSSSEDDKKATPSSEHIRSQGGSEISEKLIL